MRGFGRGIQIIEKEDGVVELTYVEHPRFVFASPRVEKHIFHNWNNAVNFLKMWETIGHVQWWETQGKLLAAE